MPGTEKKIHHVRQFIAAPNPRNQKSHRSAAKHNGKFHGDLRGLPQPTQSHAGTSFFLLLRLQ